MDRFFEDSGFLDLILRIGIVGFVLGILLLALRLVVQMRLAAHAFGVEQFVERWRPVLNGGDAPLPDLREPYAPVFIRLWLHAYGDSHAVGDEHPGEEMARQSALRRIAFSAAADRAVARVAAQGRFLDRASAIQMLGLLGGPEAWSALFRASGAREPYLALLGVRGLLTLDPERAAPLAYRRLEARTDWPDHFVTSLAAGLNQGTLALLLSEARRYEASSPHAAIRLLGALQLVHASDSAGAPPLSRPS